MKRETDPEAQAVSVEEHAVTLDVTNEARAGSQVVICSRLLKVVPGPQVPTDGELRTAAAESATRRANAALKCISDGFMTIMVHASKIAGYTDSVGNFPTLAIA